MCVCVYIYIYIYIYIRILHIAVDVVKQNGQFKGRCMDCVVCDGLDRRADLFKPTVVPEVLLRRIQFGVHVKKQPTPLLPLPCIYSEDSKLRTILVYSECDFRREC